MPKSEARSQWRPARQAFFGEQMPSSAKALLAPVHCNGQKMLFVDAWDIINALPPGMPLTTSETAVFLRVSVTKLERMRKRGDGPAYIQGGSVGAKGTNQSCAYIKQDLLDWQAKNKVSSSMQAAIKKGQAFSTIFDLAEHEAFYVDSRGAIESMVEENLLGTVVERLGQWDIAWMTPVEAAARQWTDMASHESFAASVRDVLRGVERSIASGLEATDIASVSNDASTPTH